MTNLIRALSYAGLFVAAVALIPGPTTEWLGLAPPSPSAPARLCGIALTIVGGALALWSVVVFAFVGRGTPVPLDPPRRLVVSGPYRIIRNPMALGIGTALSGVALFYGSVGFFAGAVLFLLVIHAMVIFYEEPTLRRSFGVDYVAYCERVGRWLPRRPGRRSPRR